MKTHSTKSQILYVEDDPSHAKLVQRAFDKKIYNHDLHVVHTLQESIEYIQHHHVDLVITDYLLPDGKGLELVSNSTIKSLFPVIVLTSEGTENLAVEAMKLGAFNYIVKTQTTFADMPRIAQQGINEWNLLLKRRHAEKLLAKISEVISTQLIVLDEQGIVIFCNDAFQVYTPGKTSSHPLLPSPDENDGNLVGYDYLKFLKAYQGDYYEQSAELLQMVSRAMDGLDPVGATTFKLIRDDHSYWYEVNVHRLQILSDVNVLITVSDISMQIAQREQEHAKVLSESKISTLSPREREVLKNVSEGASNKKIAGLLHLSERTVEKHRASAMKKLSVKSVADIVKVFLSADK